MYNLISQNILATSLNDRISMYNHINFNEKLPQVS